jgi:hypothetical protein
MLIAQGIDSRGDRPSGRLTDRQAGRLSAAGVGTSFQSGIQWNDPCV